MALYTREEEVKKRVRGKVRFTEDDADENKMHVSLLRRLIDEAEGEVEMDLSIRYAIPFQTAAGTAFANLPARPTKEVLRTLCEHKAVMRVLETDYGAGSTVDASKYLETTKDRYDKALEKLTKKREINGVETNQWMYPPLLELMLAPHNSEADDGYGGQILVTGQGDGGYPAKQINDPSENYWNGFLDE